MNTHFEKIVEQIQKIDHLLNKTYPLVKEEKLFLGIIKELYSCIVYIVEQLIFDDSSISLLDQVKSLDKTKFPQTIDLFLILSELNHNLDNDLISFKRHDSYIICTNNYKVQLVSKILLNKYLMQMKDSYFELQTGKNT